MTTLHTQSRDDALRMSHHPAHIPDARESKHKAARIIRWPLAAWAVALILFISYTLFK
jgi:hypothetical protein